MDSKYIVIDRGIAGKEIIIFPDTIIHKDMFAACKNAFQCELISAGAVSVKKGVLCCYGESISLGKKCRPKEDTELLKATLIETYPSLPEDFRIEKFPKIDLSNHQPPSLPKDLKFNT
jgi:hypothetical protein